MSGGMSGAQEVRWPRLRVLADGAEVGGVFVADVVSNYHFAADCFHVGVAVSADPAGSAALMSRPGVVIDIQVSLDDGAGFVGLVQGEADQVRLDAVRGVLRLEGRDLSARLIETRTAEVFANVTASEIAETLAGRHGLAADVQATTRMVGRGWTQGRDRIGLGHHGRVTTEWDLLVGLAAVEGFDVWVGDGTLHFRPGEAGEAVTVTPSEVSGMRLERALTLAGDVEVVVRSWNVLQHRAFAQVARRGGAKGGRAQRYVYVMPGLTPDEALQVAQARLAEITRHERVVALEMPGEVSISPRGRLTLAATGTDFDQDYWVDRVERRISVAHGFRQTVHGRNGNQGREGSAWSGF